MRPVIRTLLAASAAIAVMVLGFWAYRENYATQEALKNQRALQREIAALRETIAVHRAEWAWLNRPERLSLLAAASFESLGLLPMSGAAYTPVSRVPPPRPPEPLVPPETVTDTAAGPTR